MRLRPGQTVTARIRASGASVLRYDWHVRTESTARSIGGDPETLPPLVDAAIAPNRVAGDRSGARGSGEEVRLIAPPPGNYRLFVEVRDDAGRAGYANLPFRVLPPSPPRDKARRNRRSTICIHRDEAILSPDDPPEPPR
nr:conserved hypothetical protein [Xanthomonas citri pv. citri]